MPSDIFVNNIELTIMMLSVLVMRAGNDVTITSQDMADLDNYTITGEANVATGAIRLTVVPPLPAKES